MNYELMFIIGEEADSAKVLKEIDATITKFGGKISETIDWGVRDFAYVINKLTKGHYFIVKFTAENNELNDEISRILKINEDIIRNIIIKED